MATSVYQQGGYGTAALFPNPIIARRDPTTNDKVSPTGQPYQVFQGWNNELTDATFIYLGGGNWATLAAITGTVAQLTSNAGIALPAAGNINIVGGSGVTTSAAGSTLTISLTGGGTAIDSFVPDGGTNPVVPTAAGAVTMAGTANQITTTGGVNTLTFSIPATFIAPGSIASTTTMTAGTGLTATTGNIVATAGAVNAGTTMTAGTGITATTGNIVATAGQVNAGTTMTAGTGITATTGNIVATAGAVNAGTTMTAGTGITATTGNIVATAGAVSAGTTVTGGTGVTATTGNVTASAGNLVAAGAGNGISVPVTTASGATPQTCDARVGSVTFTGVSIAAAADGTFVINNTSIAGASTRVLLTMSGVTTGAALSIKSITPAANSLTIVVTNGTGATTSTADIVFDFLVLN